MKKKIVIPAQKLPSLIAGQTEVFVRFRLVSGDKNRTSAWSPIFSATPTVPFVNEIDELQLNVIALESNMTTAQGDITTIQGDVIAVEGDVISLYAISDDNFALSVVL